MPLPFTPPCVSPAISSGQPLRAPLMEASAPLAPHEGQRVTGLYHAINGWAAQVVARPEALLANPTRDKIEALHRAIAAQPDAPYETRHYFADGLYAREIHVPAGTWVVGSIHGESHINIMSKGSATVATEAGMRRITAPATFEAVAGRRVVGYTHEDSVWTTFHANPTGESDPEKLFKMLTLDTYPAPPAVLIEGAA